MSKATEKTGTKVLAILNRLQDLHPDMTVLQARMLATIASNPGITSRRLYDIVGSNDSTASRVLAILSDIGGRKVPALYMVDIAPNPEDRREKLLFLSAKGERLFETLAKDLGQ